MARRMGFDAVTFSGRIVFIVLVAIFAILVVTTTINFIARERNPERTVTLPERIAAVVSMLESSELPVFERILRAANSSDLAISLSDKPPPVDDTVPRLPGVEWRVGQQLDEPAKHDVYAVFRSVYPDRPLVRLLDRNSPASNSPLEISVSLTKGGYVNFVTRGSAARRVFGVPPGFALGLVGAALAMLAIWAIMREARPLRALEKAVNQFAGDANPQPVTPQGASDLRKLTNSFNAMQARIAQLVEGRTLLLGAISHDMRTYLTRLRLRMESHPNEEIRGRAIRDLEQMSDLLDNALALARGTEGGQRIEPVNVPDLLRRELEDRKSDTIQLFDTTTRAGVCVSSDRTALRRLFNNLIDNAVRYGTRVEIHVANTGNNALGIWIDDDGPGIPSDRLQAVFEPFYTVDPSRSHETGGSGLGLAIARQIARASGGEITAGQSSLGGARMQVTLPITE